MTFALVTLGACRDSVPTAPQSTVYFALDAPLCSSVLPVQFSIDSALVGTDTFRVNLAPNHTTSAAFTTSAGIHVLGARVVGGYVWADTVVSLGAGAVLTKTLPFYCS
jgi:hypothetical protein